MQKSRRQIKITRCAKAAALLMIMLVLVISSVASGYAVSQEEKDAAEKAAKDAKQAAEDSETRKKEAQDAAKKRAEAVSNFEDAEKKLNEIQAQIEVTESEIAATRSSIEVTMGEIEETRADIKAKEEDILKQNKALGNRLTAMYKTGSAGLIDVVLSSDSVESLLTNWGMVHRILESDQEMLAKLQKEHKELEGIKAELQVQQEVLEGQEASLQEHEIVLEGQKTETDELKRKYQAEADKLHAMQKEKEAEAAQMAAEAAAMQAEAEAMLAEIERKEKEEAEARARAEAEARAREEAAKKSSESSGGSEAASVPDTSGEYAWPLDSNWIQTDVYGWRICPFHGREFHNGLDLALSSGTNGAPVYAIANGVVTKASWYGGYGNCVMYAIKGGYTILYGHLSGFNCSSGDVVKKGQVLGYVGSTGNSTGPHLHFTVFKGGDTINPYSLY